MLHRIAESDLGPQASSMTRAIEACVHCGFCLAACPTYRLLGEEMDSPRGRILLMKSALEGDLTTDEVRPYLDPCLGCLACEPACPSGVAYRELLHPFRDHARRRQSRSLLSRLRHRLLHATLPFPRRFRLLLALGRSLVPLRAVLPAQLRPPLDFAAVLPRRRQSGSARRPLPRVYPAQGKRRARVALLAGCVQQVLRPEINWATLRVLANCGVEVVTPRDQGCCGSLALHEGDWDQARRLARVNLQSLPEDVDALVTNAAGCSSGMGEYPLLFAGTRHRDKAQSLAGKVKDIAVFLDELGWQRPVGADDVGGSRRVAYQDACHLAHAQGIRSAPRRLLRSLPNVTLVELPEADLCCGSAGTYNLEQPELAWQLGERKIDAILGAGVDTVATGNIGCLIQLQVHLRARGLELPVVHTVELLDPAWQGP